MCEVIAGLGISLDGHVARPGGAVDFAFMPKYYSMAPFVASVDAAVTRRETYEAAFEMGGSFGGSSMET